MRADRADGLGQRGRTGLRVAVARARWVRPCGRGTGGRGAYGWCGRGMGESRDAERDGARRFAACGPRGVNGVDCPLQLHACGVEVD